MAVQVIPYEPAHEPLVQAFNRRLAERGTSWRFYDRATPDWLAPGDTPNVRRDFYLGMDDDGVVRAGYCLKPERFLLRGEPFEFTSIQGPVSEGLVDPAYSMLAFQLIRDMESRARHLFAWGASDRVLELLLRLQWRSFQMPFQLRIQRPVRFMRRNAFLRQKARNRRLLDFLALSGAGALGVGLAQAALGLSGRSTKSTRPETTEVERFGPWADDIWRAAAPQYGLIALRDQATMNARLPAGGWPPAKILQMRVGATTVGWAVVMDTQFQDDRRFGALRVGSIVDALATPGSEAGVVRAATRWLSERGVDAVVSNFTHPTWRNAFKVAGFLSSANRRTLLVSWEATQAFEGSSLVGEGLHLTPIDGDGPHGL